MRGCPRLLIFVQGAARQNGGGDADTCWGGSFTDAKRNMNSPVPTLRDQSKLVFSPHAYGPSLYKLAGTAPYMPRHFRQPIDEYKTALPAKWDSIWGFATDLGMRPPLVLSEVGGDMTCCDQRELHSPGADAAWQVQLIQYLDRKDAGLFYFCLNPFSDDTGGLLQKDWMSPDRMKLLLLSVVKSTRVHWAGMSPFIPPTPPPKPPALPPPPPPSPSPPPARPCPLPPSPRRPYPSPAPDSPPSPYPMWPPSPPRYPESTIIVGETSLPKASDFPEESRGTVYPTLAGLGHAGSLSAYLFAVFAVVMLIALLVLTVMHHAQRTARQRRARRSGNSIPKGVKKKESHRKSHLGSDKGTFNQPTSSTVSAIASAEDDEWELEHDSLDDASWEEHVLRLTAPKLDDIFKAIVSKHTEHPAAKSGNGTQSRVSTNRKSRKGYGKVAHQEEDGEEEEDDDDEEEE